MRDAVPSQARGTPSAEGVPYVEIDAAEVGIDVVRLDRLRSWLDNEVESRRMPGWLIVLARGGKVAHVDYSGYRDVESGEPVELDTIWRIYSMTKPITAVAAMILWEEGLFELSDPIARFIPGFRDMRVFTGGSGLSPQTEPARAAVCVEHLLTHTAGLTYGFHHAHPVDEMYRRAGFDRGLPASEDLLACCEEIAELPLVFQPGSEWNYSIATDVLGCVLEVVSGQPLDRLLADRIFDPLGMKDTAFTVEKAEAGRLARLYTRDPAGQIVADDERGQAILSKPKALSAGGGLASSASDYHRFSELLRGRGEVEGIRLYGPQTHKMMVENRLPGGSDLAHCCKKELKEAAFPGSGFGLGMAVVTDPSAKSHPASAGELSWGGSANTTFWVDPSLDLTVTFFTQVAPSDTSPIHARLHQLVLQAICS